MENTSQKLFKKYQVWHYEVAENNASGAYELYEFDTLDEVKQWVLSERPLNYYITQRVEKLYRTIQKQIAA